MEMEIAVMWPRAKESWRPPEAEEARILPWSPQKESALLTP